MINQPSILYEYAHVHPPWPLGPLVGPPIALQQLSQQLTAARNGRLTLHEN